MSESGVDKLRMESADMTERNVEKIGALFPGVITEIEDEDGVLKKGIDFDLLYQVLIDWGLPLDLKHEMEDIDGFNLHIVDNNALIACFDSNIPESVMRKIGEKKPLRAVFRDGSFKSSPEKLNIEGIFKTIAPETRLRVI